MSFKGSKGVWHTRKLFYEYVDKEFLEYYQPQYTLHDIDREIGGVTYKSLYLLFMDSVDEYDFSKKHLGGPAHWRDLQKSVWFSEGRGAHRGSIAWKEDMRSRDESNAKKVLLLAVGEGDLNAAKKLYDISKLKNITKRGTFLKDEVRKEAALKIEDKEFLDSAAMRLNVVSIRD